MTLLWSILSGAVGYLGEWLAEAPAWVWGCIGALLCFSLYSLPAHGQVQWGVDASARAEKWTDAPGTATVTVTTFGAAWSMRGSLQLEETWWIRSESNVVDRRYTVFVGRRLGPVTVGGVLVREAVMDDLLPEQSNGHALGLGVRLRLPRADIDLHVPGYRMRANTIDPPALIWSLDMFTQRAFYLHLRGEVQGAEKAATTVRGGISFGLVSVGVSYGTVLTPNDSSERRLALTLSLNRRRSHG